ncbi:MAG: helix-turn-helix transcriptional regulator [Deltaproteobacteria bacterium]|nr:helix-turn-helix transcriptional regulator [Deltaproteobacteria bacterium]
MREDWGKQLYYPSLRKKQLILKVTTEVFAEKGFNKTTISQIARKAKIAKGSIYRYTVISITKKICCPLFPKNGWRVFY